MVNELLGRLGQQNFMAELDGLARLTLFQKFRMVLKQAIDFFFG